MAKAKDRYTAAVALEYGATDEHAARAPAVTVKGAGGDAAEIVRLARRFGVPVVEDGAAARALIGVPLDQQIPADLFEAVAVILRRLEEPAPSANDSGGRGRRRS